MSFEQANAYVAMRVVDNPGGRRKARAAEEKEGGFYARRARGYEQRKKTANERRQTPKSACGGVAMTSAICPPSVLQNPQEVMRRGTACGVPSSTDAGIKLKHSRTCPPKIPSLDDHGSVPPLPVFSPLQVTPPSNSVVALPEPRESSRMTPTTVLSGAVHVEVEPVAN